MKKQCALILSGILFYSNISLAAYYCQLFCVIVNPYEASVIKSRSLETASGVTDVDAFTETQTKCATISARLGGGSYYLFSDMKTYVRSGYIVYLQDGTNASPADCRSTRN